MEYQTKEQVFDAFMREELSYIDAIEVLVEQFDMYPREAEALVEAWESLYALSRTHRSSKARGC